MTDEVDEVMERAFTLPLKAGKKPRYVVEGIPSHLVTHWWPIVRDLVEQACVGPSHFMLQTIDDVLRALTTADCQLWVVLDQKEETPALAGVCVTTVRVFPQAKAVEGSIAGRNFMAWRAELERVIGLARDRIGARYLMLHTAEPALQALFRRRGWKPVSTVFVKDLADG